MILEASIKPVSENVAIVVLKGPLTLGFTLKTLDMQLQDAISSRGLPHLAVDMSAVPYIDSAGLGLLVQTSGLVTQKGGSFRLAAVTERVASVLRMTRADTILTVDPDVKTSLAELC